MKGWALCRERCIYHLIQPSQQFREVSVTLHLQVRKLSLKELNLPTVTNLVSGSAQI